MATILVKRIKRFFVSITRAIVQMGKAIEVKRDKCLEHDGRRHLPLPTGPYQVVGTRDVMTGISRVTGNLVRLYYPAADQSKDIREHYLRWPNWVPHENYRMGYAQFAGLRFKPFIRGINWMVGHTFIPVLPNAQPLRQPGRRLPLVVFSHGLGGCRTTYSTICTELASHGFMVAAVEHRDNTACATFYAKGVRISMSTSNPELYSSQIIKEMNEEEDEEVTIDSGVVDETDDSISSRTAETSNVFPGVKMEWIPYVSVSKDKKPYNRRNKQIHHRVRECSRILDLLEALNSGFEVHNILDGLLDPKEFEEVMDLDKAVIMGHSMGGATTLMALAAEHRFKIGVCLDGWMYPIRKESYEMINQPICFINTDKFQTEENIKKMKEFLTSWENEELRERENEVENEIPIKAHRRMYMIKDTVHSNHSDLPFVLNWLSKMLFGAFSKRSPFTAMDITTSIALRFIADHLDHPVPVEKEIYIGLQRKKIVEGIPKKFVQC